MMAPFNFATWLKLGYFCLGQVVTFENTLFFIGGSQGSAISDTTDEILQFEPDTETWIQREERMTTMRSSFFATLVNRSDSDCQEV